MTAAVSSVAAWLERLQQTHQAATPGPWTCEPNFTGGWALARARIEDVDGMPVHTPSGWTGADAAAIVAAHNDLPKLVAAVRAVLTEHRPLVNDPTGSPACPECFGGIFLDEEDALGARSCGCWGLSTPVCSSCADHHNGKRYALQWPCPTVTAVAAALVAEETP